MKILRAFVSAGRTGTAASWRRLPAPRGSRPKRPVLSHSRRDAGRAATRAAATLALGPGYWPQASRERDGRNVARATVSVSCAACQEFQGAEAADGLTGPPFVCTKLYVAAALSRPA